MNNSPWMVSCTLTLQTFAAAAIDIFRSSSDKSVALYLLILLQSSVVIIHHVICIHTINLSEEGKQPPKRDSRVCLHCCIAFGSPQAVCALGLRCIVDVEFSRWRRRSRNFPGYMLYISIDIVLFWESYPQLHKLILIYDFFVKKKNQHSSLQSKTRSTKIHPLRAWNLNPLFGEL